MIPSPSSFHHVQCLQPLQLLKHQAVRTSSFYQMKPSSQPAPCSLGLPSAPSPVHGELGHKSDIVRPGGRWLMGQEGDMHTVHSELLLTELEAGVFLAEMCQGPLQLRESRGEGRGLGWESKSQTRLGPAGAERGRVCPCQGKTAPSPAQPQVGVGWGTQRALSAEGSHCTPRRSGGGCGRTPHACSSHTASLVSSSGSPVTREGIGTGVGAGVPTLGPPSPLSAPRPNSL